MKSKPKPNRSAAPAAIQPLESRLMLAGNITAVVQGGYLNITGDAASNEFTVAVAGQGRRRVATVTGTGGTTINTKQKTEVQLRGLIASVRINTGNGNDTVRVTNATLPQPEGGLSIITGNGDDTIELEEATIPGRLFISTGAGDDTLTTTGGAVTLTTEIHMGAGNDTINLGDTNFTRRFFAGLGAGDDRFSPGEATFKAENRFVDGQGGQDLIFEGEDFEEVNSTFSQTRGWVAGFSDYARADQDNLERRSGIRSIPTVGGNGFQLSSKNLSDDVFQFVKRKVTGLRPNTNYMVRFDITFASDVTTGMLDIGGKPADDVFLKVGGSTAEPTTRVARGGRVVFNLDKGENNRSGRQMTRISTIANGETSTDATSRTFRSVTRRGFHARPIRTDAQGNLWVVVGTDSDFQATTNIFFQSINLGLLPVT